MSVRIAFLLAALLCCSSSLIAQGEQSLPAGYLTTLGGGSSSYPFNSSSNHKWQWHYDSDQFIEQSPIFITKIYVRPTSAITSFDFPSVEVLMASSPTDYSILGNGVQSGHDDIFDNNLNADAMIVRAAAPFVGTNVLAASWVEITLDEPFLYDASIGDDFIVQIRKCSTVSTWGSSIDGVSGSPGLNGGNRYGHTSDCSATIDSFSNNEFVPSVKIEWAPSDPQYTITSMVGGQYSRFSIQYIDPRTPVTFLWSMTGPGPTAIGLGDLMLSPPISMSFPILSQPDGFIEFSTLVPPSMSGLTFYTQSAVTRDGIVVLSNALAMPVQ